MNELRNRIDTKTVLETISKIRNHNPSIFIMSPRVLGEALFYIKKKKMNLRVFLHKWYDVVSKKFFVEEYVNEDELSPYAELKTIIFDDFASFYSVVKDEMYFASCYFGYVFSEEEIIKYRIEIKKLNFKALIKDRLSKYTYDFVLSEEKRNQISAIKSKEMDMYIKNHPAPNNGYELKKLHKEFNKEFGKSDFDYTFFEYFLKNDKRLITHSLIDYAINFDCYYMPHFLDILFLCGVEAAEYLIEKYDPIDCSYNTRKKRKYLFKDLLNLYKNGLIKIKSEKYYKSEDSSYYLAIKYYINREPYQTRRYRFSDFEEFCEYLKDDLTHADLSFAPLTREEIEKHITDKSTIFPFSRNHVQYVIEKVFDDKNKKFVVTQRWKDGNGNVLLSKVHEFERFFDFFYFLDGDLSNADLIMCDGLESLKRIKVKSFENIKLRSSVLSSLSIQNTANLISLKSTSNYKNVEQNEIATIKEFQLIQNDQIEREYSISYVSDIHLIHRMENSFVKTINDAIYVLRTIVNNIDLESSPITLFGGDISSDFDLYRAFIELLSKRVFRRHFYFTLGNHELWAFPELNLESIIKKYKTILEENNMHLLHNNLFYMIDNRVYEIGEEELKSISKEELRNKVRGASYCLFGGIGFAGKNKSFNAESYIYLNVLNRDEEILETNRFLTLYKKVIDSISDKNLIVMTHMPFKDWAGKNEEYVNGVVYVSGHNHRSYCFDDENRRIFTDNQVGYRGKSVHLKRIPYDFSYDWFSDYDDGIHVISKDDYIAFYRGKGQSISFNWKEYEIYMIKKKETYMFLSKNKNGDMFALNGGQLKKVSNNNLNYYFDNLLNYTDSINLYLGSYLNLQKQISDYVRNIGGEGLIHGCIIDIDYYSHLYLNPVDLSLTPYFAYSIVEKYVYRNVPSLLKSRCPKMYEKLLGLELNSSLPSLSGGHNEIDLKTTYFDSTEIYRISRIIKGLQFTTKYNVVRFWNDNLLSSPTNDKGKLILCDLLENKTQ